MVRRKCLIAEDLDSRVAEAVLGVNPGRYKSSYEAAKRLGLSRDRKRETSVPEYCPPTRCKQLTLYCKEAEDLYEGKEVTAENETKQHARNKGQKRGTAISYEAKSEDDTEEEGKEDIEAILRTVL
ncbi:hypothetical protein V1515DRAFT_622093 [Lipomyces mesembrius]